MESRLQRIFNLRFVLMMSDGRCAVLSLENGSSVELHCKIHCCKVFLNIRSILPWTNLPYYWEIWPGLGVKIQKPFFMVSFQWKNRGYYKRVLQGQKKSPAKFGDTCSVRADGLCIGCLGQWAERGREYSNMQEFFRTTLYMFLCSSLCNTLDLF